MKIRLATIADANAISDLIQSVAHYFTIDPQGRGAELFLTTIDSAAIEQCIDSPSFLYLVCIVQERIAGVLAVRGGTHLYHLFVATEFQQRGLGRALWNQALGILRPASGTKFTVNSTPHAVAVYERFGFRQAGPRVEKNGIAFVPMTLHL